jgi:hypothetical protein
VNYSELSDEELSRAVAERLGYKQTGHGWWEDADGKLLDDPAYMPEWATDIGAAWGLVDMTHKNSNNFRLSNKGGGSIYWWCYIADCVAQSTSAPRAIAEAFLMATEAGK